MTSASALPVVCAVELRSVPTRRTPSPVAGLGAAVGTAMGGLSDTIGVGAAVMTEWLMTRACALASTIGSSSSKCQMFCGRSEVGKSLK